MYDSTTAYVTRDTYEEFSGIDLNFELKSSQSDNPTLQVNIFLKQQQQWLYTFMQMNFNSYKLSEYWDDDVFTQALLWQIKHVLNYGEDNMIDRTAYVILKNSGLADPAWSGGY